MGRIHRAMTTIILIRIYHLKRTFVNMDAAVAGPWCYCSQRSSATSGVECAINAASRRPRQGGATGNNERGRLGATSCVGYPDRPPKTEEKKGRHPRDEGDGGLASRGPGKAGPRGRNVRAASFSDASARSAVFVPSAVPYATAPQAALLREGRRRWRGWRGWRGYYERTYPRIVHHDVGRWNHRLHWPPSTTSWWREWHRWFARGWRRNTWR